MTSHSVVCINLLSFCHSFQPSPSPTKCTESNRYPQVDKIARCDAWRLFRRLSQFVGEEIYNVVPFLFINYRIYMALDETMKTILIYV